VPEAWNHTSWVTNHFDPDTRPVPLVLVGVMLASLIISPPTSSCLLELRRA
jgi:low temperature requirement protein LtrA